MRTSYNVIGPNIIKYRHLRGLTLNMLLAKLQLLKCNITFQILANMETGRCSISDTRILYVAKALRISVLDLFPEQWRDGRTMQDLAEHYPTRRLRKTGSRKKRRPPG
jgi:transcriptional regulator with XRE-family HTH domain